VNTWKIIFATLVIFGAGVVTGGLLVSYSDRTHIPGKAPAEDPHKAGLNGSTNAGMARTHFLPVPLRKDFIDRLDKELKLTPAQREHIEKIMSHGQEQAKRTWQKIEPEMNGVLTEARDRIRCELTPAQQTQFEELLKQKGRGSKQDKTNAPSSTVTNSANLEIDSLLCMFGIKMDCLSSNYTTAPVLLQTEKAPLPRLTEPGS
jgi:hypothetical protein